MIMSEEGNPLVYSAHNLCLISYYNYLCSNIIIYRVKHMEKIGINFAGQYLATKKLRIKFYGFVVEVSGFI